MIETLLAASALALAVFFMVLSAVRRLKLPPRVHYLLAGLAFVWIVIGSLLIYMAIGAPRIVDMY